MTVFKLFLYALAACIIGAGLLSSCATTKRHKTTYSLLRKDSIATKVNTDLAQSETSLHKIERQDTAIAIDYKRILAQYSAEQLKPLFTAAGEAVERVYRIDTNGLRATITAMIDGSISVKCEADSYKILVQNLLRENAYYKSSSTVTKDSTSVMVSKQEISMKEVFVKVKRWSIANWGILSAIIAFLVIQEIIHLKKARK